MFKAVVFDWDGTLAKTKDIILHSFQKALEELPIEVDEKIIKNLLGKSAKEIFFAILKRSGIPLNEKTLNDLVKKRVQAEIELSSCIELKDGALIFLLHLKEKLNSH